MYRLSTFIIVYIIHTNYHSITDEVRTIRSVPYTTYIVMRMGMNTTRIGNESRNISSSTSGDSTNDRQHLESYIIPTVMSCPLVISIYIIVRLYRKLKLLNTADRYNPPILRMSAYETDL